MITSNLIRHSILCLSLFVAILACADMNLVDPSEDNHKSFGQSAQIVYRCEVQTITADHVTWHYQTDEIMNLMDKVDLTVARNDETYGPFSLLKIGTDTFSDGNLTVQLVQRGALKSILVNHNNMSLTAQAENGWCSAVENDQYANHSDHWQNNSVNNAQENRWGENQAENNAYQLFEVHVVDECPNPCLFSVKSSISVQKVVYQVDEWIIGEQLNANENFSMTYSFNQQGPRTLIATGYDAYGNFVTSDSTTFITLTDGQASRPNSMNSSPDVSNGTIRLEIPYYYQYNNLILPSATCQNSSIAMVLSHYGTQIRPDEITEEFGHDAAKSVFGLQRVYNILANRMGIASIDSYERGTIAQLKTALDQGKPVITHGYFTAGHIVVVVGYNEDGYFVNDPAGTWDLRYGGRYPNAGGEQTAGRSIFYPKANFELAIMSFDGRTLDSAYLHIPR